MIVGGVSDVGWLRRGMKGGRVSGRMEVGKISERFRFKRCRLQIHICSLNLI